MFGPEDGDQISKARLGSGVGRQPRAPAGGDRNAGTGAAAFGGIALLPQRHHQAALSGGNAPPSLTSVGIPAAHIVSRPLLYRSLLWSGTRQPFR